MTKIIGVLMCVAGVAIGLYAGLWWAFIGGIIDVVAEIRAVEMDGENLAIGIGKVLFAQAIGGFSAMFLFVPGMVMLRGY